MSPDSLTWADLGDPERGEVLTGLYGICWLGELSRAALGQESPQAPLLCAENPVGVTFFYKNSLHSPEGWWEVSSAACPRCRFSASVARHTLSPLAPVSQALLLTCEACRTRCVLSEPGMR